VVEFLRTKAEMLIEYFSLEVKVSDTRHGSVTRQVSITFAG